MGILAWLQNGALGVWVRESLWGYPLILSSHAIGMAIVAGMAMMIDLRVLGFGERIPIASLDRLFTLTWFGFGINLLSGLLLFTGDAERFFFQGSFQIKILLIICGGICLKLLLNAMNDARKAANAKLIAVISLVCWTCAIIAGRLTAYI